MDSSILPHRSIALRLPSGLHKVFEIKPDTTVSLGKFGSFPANALLGRPYYCTYELLDKTEAGQSALRLLSASELHAEVLADDDPTPAESRDENLPREYGESSDGNGVNGTVNLVGSKKNNQSTIDDPLRQRLSMDEIEALKASGSGTKLIAQIMESHSHLDEKTAFSLAKYTVRKRAKYMKRFTALPVDASFLANWYLHERDATKIMDVREEMLGLIASWSNVQCGDTGLQEPKGRWLVVDDSPGLLVAAMAERMGILHPAAEAETSKDSIHNDTNPHEEELNHVVEGDPAPSITSKHRAPEGDFEPTLTNTLTLIHPAVQPNISLLSYFSYDPFTSKTSFPANQHPLHNHLKTMTWLQLLHPEEDISLTEPTPLTSAELHDLKPGKRGAYYRKRRRWQRAAATVEDTQSGDFDGLVVATSMDVLEVLHHLVPLLRGAAPVVVFSPFLEPIAEAADAYSTARKSSFLEALDSGQEPSIPGEDFPLDPRLILAPSIQTARSTKWQALPGRTHPIMTSKGGPDGYLFTGTRVLPASGHITARGNYAKKRKTEDSSAAELNPIKPENSDEG